MQAAIARAIRTPPPLNPSEWAETYRYLPPSMTAEPGPWRNERTPYLAGLMDATVERGVEEVVFLKAVQVGFSEGMRNLIGYWVDHDPGPAMLVMPSQQSAQEAVDERIRPLLYETPRLKPHVGLNRSDDKLSAIRMDTMTLYTGWAGSPQALASRPIRYIVFDEVDKYPPFAGKEADPISLGMKRLTTYGHRALAMIGSTPTTRHGNVWQRWEGCTDRRHYYVPCPSCDVFQRLTWPRVKYPKRTEGEDPREHAERVESGLAARYACEACDALWTDEQKNAALRRGEWRSETPGSSNRRVGFHLNSIYSPWLSLSKLAGEWIRSQGDPSKLMDFRNSRLAEPFEQQASSTKPTIIADKIKIAGPPREIPAWAGVVIATADVQEHHLYYVLRAWGPGMPARSQLVDYGLASDFDELRRIVFERTLPGPHGEQIAASVLAIDARYRTTEVYEFALQDPSRIWPVMGDAKGTAFLKETPVKSHHGVIRRNVNTAFWKDRLHGFIHDADPNVWLPHNQTGEDYIRHMTGEHKVLDPKTRQTMWVPVSSGARVDYWDCEYHQTWVAQTLGVQGITSLKDAHTAQKTREQTPPPPERMQASGGGGARIGGSWSARGRR